MVTARQEDGGMAMLVSIDYGGMLTDICVCAGSQVWHIKTLTTPHDLGPVPVRRAGQGVRPPWPPGAGAAPLVQAAGVLPATVEGSCFTMAGAG
jgi:hypothetical protein